MQNHNLKGSFLNQDQDYRQSLIEIGTKQVQNTLLLMLYTSVGTNLLRIFREENREEMMSYCLSIIYISLIQTAIAIFILKWNTGHYIKYQTMTQMISVVLLTEVYIKKSPETFVLSTQVLSALLVIDLIKAMLLVSKNNRILFNMLSLTYYFARNHVHYQDLPVEIKIFVPLFFLIMAQYSNIHDQYINKIVELSIKESENMKLYFKQTLEIIPNGVLIFNIETSDVIFSNQELLRLLGIQEIQKINEELKTFYLQKSSVAEVEAASNRSQNFSKHASCSQEPTEKQSLYSYLLQFSQIHQDNSESLFKNKEKQRYLQVKVQYINYQSQLIVIINDITRFKEIERVSQQMKSMFFASIAHELRTPLNTIIPMASKLQKSVKDLNILKYIKIIRNSAIFLQNIIEEALDMSRIENNKFQISEDYFDIRQTVNDVAEVMEFQIEQKKLQLNIDISQNVPTHIMSDQKRYQQILFNLVGNAIKFTFKGSIQIKLQMIDNQLVTDVQDSGIGIQDDQINKLFKFFGTIEKSRKINKGGMGFGLTICKMILQQLEGDISVKSKYSAGSTFTFKIKVKQSYNKDNDLNNEPPLILNDFQAMASNQVESQLQIRINKTNDPFDLQNSLISDCQWNDNQNNNNSFTQSISNLQEESFRGPHECFQNIFQRQAQRTPHFLRITDVTEVTDVNDERLTQRQNIADSNRKSDLFLKVLLVDDQPFNLFVLKEILMDIDNIDFIETALNGQQAIDIICNTLLTDDKKCLFDVVLMDLHMPIMDGFQAIQKLREMNDQREINLNDTLFIAVSAITKKQFQSSQFFELFNEFIDKPVSHEKLADLFSNASLSKLRQ